MVVTRICLPERFSFAHMSSVPIISPSIHSRMLSVTVYHPASKMESPSSPTPWGPNAMPVTSQPNIAGIPSRVTPLPT